MTKIGDTGSIYKIEEKAKHLVAKEGQVLIFCNTCDKESILDKDGDGFKIRRTRSGFNGEHMWWQIIPFVRCANCASIEVEVKKNG